MTIDTAPAPISTTPAQRVAVLAELANRLTHLAEIAVRGHRPDIALTLITEARAVLVCDLVQDRAVPDGHAANATAAGHVQRVLRRVLSEPDRETVTQLRWEKLGAGADCTVGDDHEPTLPAGVSEDDVAAAAAAVGARLATGSAPASALVRVTVAELAARGRIAGDDGARDENGDWWTCSLHGGAITQDCQCAPAFGLGDLEAAAEAFFDQVTGGNYGEFATLEDAAKDGYAAKAAAVVLAYHRAGTVAAG